MSHFCTEDCIKLNSRVMQEWERVSFVHCVCVCGGDEDDLFGVTSAGLERTQRRDLCLGQRVFAKSVVKMLRL